jgi:hypothetical protein
MSATHVIVTIPPTTSADVLTTVRGITGRPLGEIKQQLATGAPLVEGELFDHDEFDAKVAQLVAELEAKGQPVAIQIGARRVTSAVLANMLRAHADEVERQGELLNDEAEE